MISLPRVLPGEPVQSFHNQHEWWPEFPGFDHAQQLAERAVFLVDVVALPGGPRGVAQFVIQLDF